jgi:CBS domain-containing protein
LYTFLEQVVADHMTRNVKTVTRGMTLRELGDLFERDDFNAYPVEENSQVVGLVSKFDFLASFVFTPAHMIPRYEDLMRWTVADVMTSEFIYVATDTKLTRVLQLMVDHRLRSMPVIDSDQRIVGMISREDVIRALQWSVGGKTARVPDERRSISDERRVQDAFEDDEVREALRARHEREP